jgi:hypothetical protein
MTPREKAVRLVDIYLDEVINETDINFPLELPKRLAMITVNELILQCWDYREIDLEKSGDYWQQVKQEIEKL